MSEEIVRILVAVLVVVGVATSGLLRLRADREGGALRREGGEDERNRDAAAGEAAAEADDGSRHRGSRAGHLLQILLRSVGLAALAVLGLYVAAPSWVEPVRWNAGPALRWIGATVSVVALPAALWAVASLGPNVTATERTREGHRLVVRGPYRWIRHPLYTFGGLFWVGVILMTGLWPLAVLILVAWTFLVVRTSREEEFLEEEFGDRYRRYAARTGRFFPRPDGGSKPDPGPDP